jgi:pimeloyl-ACP methyl ester carboxylesterase
MMAFVYDLSQLLHHLGQEQPTIVAHSLGANIALRFTGLYPDLVERLVAVEGLGPSPAIQAERAAISAAERHRRWIVNKRAAAGRTPKRYATFGDALRRMRAENANLSEAQARHLTIHGVNRNEDGTWSWKFDNYFNILPFRDLDYRDIEALWNEVTCPTLLVHGSLSSTPNPAITGRINHFRNARMVEIENAGHWLYNDQPGQFLQVLKEFLGGGNASGSAGDLPRVRASADIEASLTGSAR